MSLIEELPIKELVVCNHLKRDFFFSTAYIHFFYRSQTASHKTDIKHYAKNSSRSMLVLLSQKAFVERIMVKASVFFLENGQNWKCFKKGQNSSFILLLWGRLLNKRIRGAKKKKRTITKKFCARCFLTCMYHHYHGHGFILLFLFLFFYFFYFFFF